MSAQEDNVMDLLDSLDVKQGQKQKPKKSNTKRKENKKATGEDILGFLDELESKKNTPEPKSEETAVEVPTATEEPAAKQEPGAQQASIDTKDTADTSSESSSHYVDPVSTISTWWSRNKGGLWSKAQETIQNAAQDAVNQARQAESMVDKGGFSLNAIQSRLTSVLNTIVPPISRHEQLRIYLYHDMVAYPSVDRLLCEVFDYVMDQVEGGGEPQLVSEKGENRRKAETESSIPRSLNCVKSSLPEAAKLARSHIETVKQRINTENSTTTRTPQEEDDLARTSEVYISIQPVITKTTCLVTETETETLHFVVVLDDSDHNVELSTISQPLPVEWAHWLDSNGHGFKEAAIDPREWVFGWVEDALNLSFGVIAQKYVTTRMGLTHDAK